MKDKVSEKIQLQSIYFFHHRSNKSSIQTQLCSPTEGQRLKPKYRCGKMYDNQIHDVGDEKVHKAWYYLEGIPYLQSQLILKLTQPRDEQ